MEKHNKLFSIVISFAILWFVVAVMFWFLSYGAALAGIGFPISIFGMMVFFIIFLAFIYAIWNWFKRYG